MADGLLAVRRVEQGHVELPECGPWVPTVGVPLPEAGAVDVAEQPFSGGNRLPGGEQVLPFAGLQKELCHVVRHWVQGLDGRSASLLGKPVVLPIAGVQHVLPVLASLDPVGVCGQHGNGTEAAAAVQLDGCLEVAIPGR